MSFDEINQLVNEVEKQANAQPDADSVLDIDRLLAQTEIALTEEQEAILRNTVDAINKERGEARQLTSSKKVAATNGTAAKKPTEQRDRTTGHDKTDKIDDDDTQAAVKRKRQNKADKGSQRKSSKGKKIGIPKDGYKGNVDDPTQSLSHAADSPILAETVDKVVKPMIEYALSAGVLHKQMFRRLLNKPSTSWTKADVAKATEELRQLGIDSPKQLVDFVQKYAGRTIAQVKEDMGIAAQKKSETEPEQKSRVVDAGVRTLMQVIQRDLLGKSEKDSERVKDAVKKTVEAIYRHIKDDGLTKDVILTKLITDIIPETASYQTLADMLGYAVPLRGTIMIMLDSMSVEYSADTPQEAQDAEDKTGAFGDDAPADGASEVLNIAQGGFQGNQLESQNPVLGAMRPFVDEFYNDRTNPYNQKVAMIPFHESPEGRKMAKSKNKAVRDQITTIRLIYEYLKDRNAFYNATTAEVRSTVYFVVDKNLNRQLQDKTGNKDAFAILMASDKDGKTIIGALPVMGFQSYNKSNIPQLYQKIRQDYDKWSEEHGDASVYVSGVTSHVRQVMLGHVQFTDSKTKKGDATLNKTFGVKNADSDDKFTLAVTAKGEITTGDGTGTGGRRILTPRRAVAGLPYVLVPSGKATKRFVAVPFQMDRYDKSTAKSRLGQFVKQTVKKNLKDVDLNTSRGQVALKNALMQAFGHTFHVDVFNGQIRIRCKTQEGQPEFRYYTALGGNMDMDKFADSLLAKAAQAGTLQFRVNLQFINKKVELNGNSVSYNNLVGEIAHSNLVTPHTVNDWFTVAPIDPVAWKPNDVPKEQYKKQPELPAIEHRGQKYVVRGLTIYDESGKKATGLSKEDEDVIYARYELSTKPDLQTV